MGTGVNWSDIEVLEVLDAPSDVAFSDIEVLEVLQPLDPGINISDVEVLEVLHEEVVPGTEAAPSNDIIGIGDTVRGALARLQSAGLQDAVGITDAIRSRLTRHLAGAISDTLSIADAIRFRFTRSFRRRVSDTFAVHDATQTASANYARPARLVAPMSIVPRISTINSLHLAAHPIRHPERYYEPRVKSYGTFTRAISAPVGFIRTGDANISVLDPDNSIRQKIAAKTIRKAEAEIRLGPEGGKLSAFLRPFRRSIGTVSQGPDGELSFHCRDLCFDFLERKVPGLINDTNFANLPNGSSDGFAPLVIGTVESAGGAVRCPHVDTVLHRYIVNRHAGITVTGVYRKAADSDEFELVDPGEYSIVETVYLDNGEGGGDYCTLIQFDSEQQGEIRANVIGLDLFNGLYMTNFADFLLGMFSYITWLTDRHDALNLASFEETRERVADLVCAGALTQQMTYGELVSQIQRSSNIDVFADKNDRVCIHYTTDDEEPAVDLDDTLQHYKGSVKQQLADPAYNRLPYRYGVNAAGKWIEDAYDNLADQEALGEIVEDEPLQMHWVRDPATALTVIERRAQYLDLDSFRWESEAPLVPLMHKLELANIAQISHFGGIKAGGYANEQFKVLELGMDVDQLKYRIKGIRRRLPPPSVVETLMTGVETDVNALNGPHDGLTVGEYFAVFRHRTISARRIRVMHTTDYGATWAEADEENSAVLSQDIGSFDSFARDGVVHIATQESGSGRVAYHAFDMSTHKWISVDETVVASSAYGPTPIVSIACRYPGGEPLVFFQGNMVLISGSYWRRGVYSMRSNGTWSEPAIATPDPGAYPENWPGNGYAWPHSVVSSNCDVQRVIPGRENRMHFFYSVLQPVHWATATHDEYLQVMNGDLTMNGRELIYASNFVYWAYKHNMGGYICYDSNSQLAVLRKGSFGRGMIEGYHEGARMTKPNPGSGSHPAWDYSQTAAIWLRYLEGSILHKSNYLSENPAGFLGYDDGEHALYSASSAWHTPGYVSIQKLTDGTLGAPIQASPYYSIYSGRSQHTLAGNFFKIRGKMYVGYFVWEGAQNIRFRWLQIDKLPYTG